MSHRGTNWAIGQRGLKPAAKIVLWHIADCHNPSIGCFPSQDYLARECEMSRSSINLHLNTLEERGLIRRIQARDPETKKQLPTRYLLEFEFADEPQDVVEPCPESGHGIEAETVSENGEKPCPKNAESRVRISDTNPVREPVSKPVIERESAQARSVDDEKGDQDVDPHPLDDAKRAEAVFYRAFKTWPRFDVSPKQPMLSAWAKLSGDERAAAADAVPRFLDACKRQGVNHPPAISTYLGEGMWRDHPAGEDGGEQGPKPPDDYAPPFGPVWSAWRISALLAGPDVPDAPEWQPSKRYQRVSLFQAPAASGKGQRIAERWHRLKEAMEPVPVDGELWAVWRAEHEARGWPWLPDTGQMRAVYFPKGGPDGLDEFEKAVAASAKQEAAE